MTLLYEIRNYFPPVIPVAFIIKFITFLRVNDANTKHNKKANQKQYMYNKFIFLCDLCLKK